MFRHFSTSLFLWYDIRTLLKVGQSCVFALNVLVVLCSLVFFELNAH